MKKENILLGICIAFGLLGLLSVWVDISIQMQTTLSIFSLLFTIAQALQNIISRKQAVYEKTLETLNVTTNSNIDPLQLQMFCKWFPSSQNSKWDTFFTQSGNITEILAYVILILGLSVPLPFFDNAKISTTFSLLSFSVLFLSILLNDIYEKRIKKWNDIQIFGNLIKQASDELNSPKNVEEQIKNIIYEQSEQD